jgi:hypothetical protein
MDDFIKALQYAQTLPDIASNEKTVPDLLKGSEFESLVKSVAPGTAGKIANATEYSFEYQSARLTIGKEMTAMDHGTAIFEDIDESERLKDIMDRSLSGEVVVVKKTETFLKDGTVVIWLEWMQPKAGSKKDHSFLTTSELLVPTPDPDDKDPDTDDALYTDDD